MTSAEELTTEAANLRAVCRRQLPTIRSIVEAHPDQARRAFDVLQGMVDVILRTFEAHPEAFEACRHDPSHQDAEVALSAMTAELRWLADVVAAGDSHATTCPN